MDKFTHLEFRHSNKMAQGKYSACSDYLLYLKSHRGAATGRFHSDMRFQGSASLSMIESSDLLCRLFQLTTC